MLRFHEFIEFYLYPVSLISGAVAFYIFAILLAVRVYRQQYEIRREKRKKLIKDKILFHLTNPLKDLEKVLLQYPGDGVLIAQIGAHLLRNLKGEAYENLKTALESVGIYELAFKKLLSTKEKMTAIELVAHWQRDEVKERLYQLYETGNSQVRIAALESLAYLKDEKMLEKIINNFLKMPTRSHLIISQIFQYFGSAAEPHMRELLDKDNVNLILKKAAILTLLKLKSTKIILEYTDKLLEFKDKELKTLVYMSLARGGESIPTEIIEKGLESDDWKIRQYVAICASNTFPLPAKIIKTLMEDQNWLVSLSCGKALYKSEIRGYNLLKVMASKDDLAGRRAKAILEEREALYGLD